MALQNDIRSLVESYYDIQDLRIRIQNRARALRQGVSEQDEIFTEAVVSKRMQDIEKEIDKFLQKEVTNHEIWNKWLVDVKGIGHVMAAGLISWVGDVTPRMEDYTIPHGKEKGKVIQVERGYKTISKLWAYAGLHVDEDGRAMKRKKGEQSNWNSRLKVHCWKIGEQFVKSKCGYRALYDQFRKEYDEKWRTSEDCGSKGCHNKGKTLKKEKGRVKLRACMDGHRYAAAKRKTVKVFLAHYFMKSRELLGLPEEHPFIIGRDNHSHLIEVVEE